MRRPTFDRLRGCTEWRVMRQGRLWLATLKVGPRTFSCSDSCPERATRKALSDAGL